MLLEDRDTMPFNAISITGSQNFDMEDKLDSLRLEFGIDLRKYHPEFIKGIKLFISKWHNCTGLKGLEAQAIYRMSLAIQLGSTAINDATPGVYGAGEIWDRQNWPQGYLASTAATCAFIKWLRLEFGDDLIAYYMGFISKLNFDPALNSEGDLRYNYNLCRNLDLVHYIVSACSNDDANKLLNNVDAERMLGRSMDKYFSSSPDFKVSRLLSLYKLMVIQNGEEDAAHYLKSVDLKKFGDVGFFVYVYLLLELFPEDEVYAITGPEVFDNVFKYIQNLPIAYLDSDKMTKILKLAGSVFKEDAGGATARLLDVIPKYFAGLASCDWALRMFNAIELSNPAAFEEAFGNDEVPFRIKLCKTFMNMYDDRYYEYDFDDSDEYTRSLNQMLEYFLYDFPDSEFNDKINNITNTMPRSSNFRAVVDNWLARRNSNLAGRADGFNPQMSKLRSMLNKKVNYLE